MTGRCYCDILLAYIIPTAECLEHEADLSSWEILCKAVCSGGICLSSPPSRKPPFLTFCQPLRKHTPVTDIRCTMRMELRSEGSKGSEPEGTSASVAQTVGRVHCHNVEIAAQEHRSNAGLCKSRIIHSRRGRFQVHIWSLYSSTLWYPGDRRYPSSW